MRNATNGSTFEFSKTMKIKNVNLIDSTTLIIREIKIEKKKKQVFFLINAPFWELLCGGEEILTFIHW